MSFLSMEGYVVAYKQLKWSNILAETTEIGSLLKKCIQNSQSI